MYCIGFCIKLWIWILKMDLPELGISNTLKKCIRGERYVSIYLKAILCRRKGYSYRLECLKVVIDPFLARGDRQVLVKLSANQLLRMTSFGEGNCRLGCALQYPSGSCT